MKRLIPGLAAFALFFTGLGQANASIAIAYDDSLVPAGQLQNWAGSLGMEFSVTQKVYVTALGAFDNGLIPNLDGSTGGGVSVGIYNVNNILSPVLVGSLVSFSSSSSGVTLPGDLGDSFKSLGNSYLTLIPGNVYSVVSYNDSNYNSFGNPNPYSTNQSGGLVNYLDSSYAYGNSFPAYFGYAPGNRYDAGTFALSATPPAPSIPEPSTFVVWSVLGALGLAAGFWPRPKVTL